MVVFASRSLVTLPRRGLLGSTQVKRPSSFEFEGAWLFNFGVGLHLIKGQPPSRPSKVVPKSCHLSFQASSLEEVESSLEAWGIDYVKNVFVEDGIQVGQLFFHDPDNNMIEVCNCDVLPVVPLTESNLACAARPLATAPLATQARSPLPFPAPSSSVSSGSDSEETQDRACSVASTSSACGTAIDHLTDRGTARRSHSFSNSSMSGFAAGLDLSAMSITTSDLDDWPAHGGGAASCGDCLAGAAKPGQPAVPCGLAVVTGSALSN
ncbi:hypothetical protein GPECTOR_2g1200 [Gonium pectorale]|uniref:VOC domain-containing protein n=1 Tax=Gonium pectorale TaxID=33097 RepID=A0A150H242_GONPE|nr:hypothetical protein GPECTOR_2g1200 [Gonium pectorale]|eukprot:KXZ55650.1 hypothetical protein GPECTOR_2g1200 [Gonium pectorale]